MWDRYYIGNNHNIIYFYLLNLRADGFNALKDRSRFLFYKKPWTPMILTVNDFYGMLIFISIIP